MKRASLIGGVVLVSAIAFATDTATAQTPAAQPLPAVPPCLHPHYEQLHDGQFVFTCQNEPFGTLLHALIAGGAALQGADAVQTAYVLGSGGGHEMNPVLQPFTQQPAAFGAVKLGLTALTTWGLVKIHAQPGRKARWITIALIAEEYLIETWCIVHNERVLRELRR